MKKSWMLTVAILGGIAATPLCGENADTKVTVYLECDTQMRQTGIGNRRRDSANRYSWRSHGHTRAGGSHAVRPSALA